MLTSARDHYRRQQQITAKALIKARQVWRKGPLAVAQIVAAYQLAAARDASDSVPLMLAEQGTTGAAAAPVGQVAITSLAGIASDGRALDTLFAQAKTIQQLSLMVVTQVQDAARVSGGMAVVARPGVAGYTRMLNPPSCSRCVVLAGKWFRWNDGFERHPKCDCRHVPAGDEQMANELGLISDPEAYFESLSEAEQDRIFTKDGAQAIRDSADISRVVNARRGMGTTQTPSGRNILVRNQFGTYSTTEATTKRGINRKVRLMPESIYELGKGDRAETIRLLKIHGYIL